MKRKIFSLLFVALFAFAYTGCREKTTEDKVEDGVEEVGDDIENAFDDN